MSYPGYSSIFNNIPVNEANSSNSVINCIIFARGIHPHYEFGSLTEYSVVRDKVNRYFLCGQLYDRKRRPENIKIEIFIDECAEFKF